MIIGIDPSYRKPIALAGWRNGKLVLVNKTPDILLVLDMLGKAEKVYIEDQYFKCNPQVLIGLSRCVGEIIGVCRMLEIRYELVAPSTWQSKVGLKYGKKPGGVSPYFWKKDKEKRLKDKASEIVGTQIDDEDIGAAILISYAMGVMK